MKQAYTNNSGRIRNFPLPKRSQYAHNTDSRVYSGGYDSNTLLSREEHGESSFSGLGRIILRICGLNEKVLNSKLKTNQLRKD